MLNGGLRSAIDPPTGRIPTQAGDMKTVRAPVWFALALALAPGAAAQTFPTDDPVIRRIWAEGMTERSQVERLAQVLLDSIGPRLSGSPSFLASVDWVASVYRQWGITAREQYGTWQGWRRGHTHVDLIAPRQRTLEATMLAWSPGTTRPVEGEVVLLPDVRDAEAFAAWLPSVRGKFVLWSPAELTCRPDENWERLARPETVARMKAAREANRRAWSDRMRRLGSGAGAAIEQAGAAGLLTTLWSAGWGSTRSSMRPRARFRRWISAAKTMVCSSGWRRTTRVRDSGSMRARNRSVSSRCSI